jgi:hypothetical protein
MPAQIAALKRYAIQRVSQWLQPMGGVQWKPRDNNDSIRCEFNHLQALRMTSVSIQKQVDRIRYGWP